MAELGQDKHENKIIKISDKILRKIGVQKKHSDKSLTLFIKWFKESGSNRTPTNQTAKDSAELLKAIQDVLNGVFGGLEVIVSDTHFDTITENYEHLDEIKSKLLGTKFKRLEALWIKNTEYASLSYKSGSNSVNLLTPEGAKANKDRLNFINSFKNIRRYIDNALKHTEQYLLLKKKAKPNMVAEKFEKGKNAVKNQLGLSKGTKVQAGKLAVGGLSLFAGAFFKSPGLAIPGVALLAKRQSNNTKGLERYKASINATRKSSNTLEELFRKFRVNKEYADLDKTMSQFGAGTGGYRTAKKDGNVILGDNPSGKEAWGLVHKNKTFGGVTAGRTQIGVPKGARLFAKPMGGAGHTSINPSQFGGGTEDGGDSLLIQIEKRELAVLEKMYNDNVWFHKDQVSRADDAANREGGATATKPTTLTGKLTNAVKEKSGKDGFVTALLEKDAMTWVAKKALGYLATGAGLSLITGTAMVGAAGYLAYSSVKQDKDLTKLNLTDSDDMDSTKKKAIEAGHSEGTAQSMAVQNKLYQKPKAGFSYWDYIKGGTGYETANKKDGSSIGVTVLNDKSKQTAEQTEMMKTAEEVSKKEQTIWDKMGASSFFSGIPEKAKIVYQTARTAASNVWQGAKDKVVGVAQSGQREKDLERAAIANGITDPKELASFMGQMGHETGGFTKMNEGKYNADSVIKLRGGQLNKMGVSNDDIKSKFASGGSSAMYDLMYSDQYRDDKHKMGNDQAGDAEKYKGRGFVQLTGKSNYAEYGKALGVDLVGNPDLAADPNIAQQIAVLYWKKKGLGEKARAGNFDAVTQGINGGMNGAEDRNSRTQAKLQQYQTQGVPTATNSMAKNKSNIDYAVMQAKFIADQSGTPIASNTNLAGTTPTTPVNKINTYNSNVKNSDVEIQQAKAEAKNNINNNNQTKVASINNTTVNNSTGESNKGGGTTNVTTGDNSWVSLLTRGYAI
jgi:predicted chitinase